jgi:hypothetical protein
VEGFVHRWTSRRYLRCSHRRSRNATRDFCSWYRSARSKNFSSWTLHRTVVGLATVTRGGAVWNDLWPSGVLLHVASGAAIQNVELLSDKRGTAISALCEGTEMVQVNTFGSNSLYLNIGLAFTNCMEQSPYWEADSHSASQEIPTFYGTPRFITVFTTARLWSLSWATWIQSTPSPLYFPKIYSNIILPSTPRSSEWSLPFRFSDRVGHKGEVVSVIR